MCVAWGTPSLWLVSAVRAVLLEVSASACEVYDLTPKSLGCQDCTAVTHRSTMLSSIGYYQLFVGQYVKGDKSETISIYFLISIKTCHFNILIYKIFICMLTIVT